MDDRQVFTPVQLQEKNIEPSKEQQNFLNRNLQLGNIDRQVFKRFGYQISKATEFDDFPFEYGGFLTQEYAKEKRKQTEALLVMSGSIEGFVRKQNNTFESNQNIAQTQKGMFSGMFGKK